MNENELKEKMAAATKWSAITEVVAKITMPIVNMILARLLTPNEFGVIATITMITSFADMCADAGFQKYIIQHEFKSSKVKDVAANVAFWTNLLVSIIIWIIIAVFSEPLAILVGSPGLGSVIIIACIQIPITAFSSVQIAKCKREFKYRELFAIRCVSICIPFIVTMPLALLGFSYWALIIGNISGGIVTTIVLIIRIKWLPKVTYDFLVLKEMISFSIWSLIESVSIWLTAWIDIFVVSTMLNQYYLGLYRTSINTVNSIMSIVAVATTTIIFSGLSRLQRNEKKFNDMFFRSQRYVSIILLPMGVGIFVYSDFVTQVMLGKQWGMASGIIGIWALTSAIKMVLGDYCSEVFRAKGKPKISFIAQLLHLIILVPVCLISVEYGFKALVYSRAWIRMQLILVQWLFMFYIIKIPILKTFKNIFPYVASASVMGLIGVILKYISHSDIWNIISIIICVIVYVILVLIFDKEVRSLTIKFIEKCGFRYKEEKEGENRGC